MHVTSSVEIKAHATLYLNEKEVEALNALSRIGYEKILAAFPVIEFAAGGMATLLAHTDDLTAAMKAGNNTRAKAKT